MPLLHLLHQGLSLGSPQEAEEDGTLSIPPSKAPEGGQRSLLMKKQPWRQSVRNLLDTAVGTPDMTQANFADLSYHT